MIEVVCKKCGKSLEIHHCTGCGGEMLIKPAQNAAAAKLLKFRFHWRAWGDEDSIVIEAATYPEACFKLGIEHFDLFEGKPPDDYELDLTKAECVE